MLRVNNKNTQKTRETYLKTTKKTPKWRFHELSEQISCITLILSFSWLWTSKYLPSINSNVYNISTDKTFTKQNITNKTNSENNTTDNNYANSTQYQIFF